MVPDGHNAGGDPGASGAGGDGGGSGGGPERVQDAAALLGRIDTLETRLAEIGAELEHNERLATLGTIAGLIAHEFNNILTPVMSYAQMALGAPGDPELTAKALHRAAEGSQRASQIAGAILNFAREFRTENQDAGAETWEADPLDPPAGPIANVERVVHEALTCMARRPEHDAIRLRLDLEHGLTGRIRPIALQHVLLNVLLNAKAALGAPGDSGGGAEGRARAGRGGSLTVSSELLADPPIAPVGAACSQGSTWNIGDTHADPALRAPHGWLCVRVTDTGHGIAPDRLARIFTPFYTTRADAPGVERQGTGLGMTLCQRLLASVGGYMIVESHVGQGTSVTIALPAAPRDADANEADDAGERAA